MFRPAEPFFSLMQGISRDMHKGIPVSIEKEPGISVRRSGNNSFRSDNHHIFVDFHIPSLDRFAHAKLVRLSYTDDSGSLFFAFPCSFGIHG